MIAMRVGVHEQAQGGVESVLGPPGSPPFPALKRACALVGVQILRAQNLHRPRAGTVLRAGHGVW